MDGRRLFALVPLLACLGGAGDAAAQQAAREPTAAYDFALAKLLAEEGRPRQALERMERAIRKLPEEPVLRIEYARLLLRAGQAERAVEEVDRARKLAPENRDVLAAVAEVHLAEGLRSAESLAAARSALETLSDLPDPDPRAMISLAQIYLQQQEPARATRILRDVDERLPGNRLVTAMLTEALIHSGRLEEATRRLQRVLERDPNDLRSRLRLAELQREAGEYADEASTLAGAPPMQRQGEEVQRRLSLALARSGDVEAALGPLESLLEERAATPDDRFVYAYVLAALGDNEQAAKVLTALLDEEPLQPEWPIELSRVLQRLQRSEEGTRHLEEAAAALRRDGRADAAAEVTMARLERLAEQGSWPRIVEALRGRLDELPAQHRERAAELLLEGLRESQRTDEALELLRSGELPLPEAALDIQKVETLRRAGQEDAARRLLGDIATSADPQRKMTAGLIHLQWDETAQSVALLEAAAAARPEHLGGLYALAEAYYEDGRKEAAEETLRRILSERGDIPHALNFLGYMLAEEGRDLQEARRMTERAVLQEPDNGAFVDSLGWALFRLGRLDEAQKYLERAARLVPDDPTILEHLGDVYRARGDHGAAQRAYRRALEVGDEDSEALERKLAALKDS